MTRTAGLQRLTQVRRAGLHEQAAARLRLLIIRGELAPGTPIQETQLSKQLGISRTPLREAVKLLSTEGLITLRPNRSPCIAILSEESIGELFEALAGIERTAAELAAARMTARELQRLRTSQVRMEAHHATGARTEYSAVNGDIHRMIVRGARNGPLREAHETLLARAERARFLALAVQQRWSNSIDEHRAILVALEERDGALAGALLHQHVLRTGETMKAQLAAAPMRAAA